LNDKQNISLDDQDVLSQVCRKKHVCGCERSVIVPDEPEAKAQAKVAGNCKVCGKRKRAVDICDCWYIENNNIIKRNER
jgi:hypothetical protein